VPSGSVVDRFGGRRSALVAVLCLLAANGVAAAAPSSALALVARGAAGVGTGLGVVAGIDYVRRTGGSALAQGVYGGILSAGGGLALAILPAVEGPLGWRAPFVTALVTGAAALVALAAAPAGSEAAAAPRRASGGGSERSLFLDARLLRLAALHMASFGLSLVAANWLVTLLKDAGYRPATAGVISSLVLVAGIVSRPLGGLAVARLADGGRRVVVGSLLVGAAGMVALALTGPAPVIVLAAAAVGMAAGLPLAAVLVAAARIRPDAPGTAVGYVNMLGNAVVFSGTPLLGLAFGSAHGGRIGFAVVGLLWAVPLLGMRGLLRTLAAGTARPAIVSVRETG
jgi:CP family cyanate transporter-like MFS transporter